jgi:hypothetical protein
MVFCPFQPLRLKHCESSLKQFENFLILKTCSKESGDDSTIFTEYIGIAL